MHIEKSKSITERATRVIPGGVNSATRRLSQPYAWEWAEGAHIRDVDGNTYLDYHAAFGPIVLGHNDPTVNAAVAKALTGPDMVGVGITEQEIMLAEKVVQHVPSAELALAFSSGSEATYMAVRLARGVTGREKLIKFQGTFHGWHDYLLMNIASPADKIGKKDPGSAGQLADAIDNTIIVPFNDLAATEQAILDHPGQIAAIFMEAIPHNIGCVLPRQDFVEGLRRLCDQHGIVLVFDEVITGFRHGLGGYQSVLGVKPDISTFAKAIANGYPCAIIAGKRELMLQFSTAPGGKVFVGGTYNGHPVGSAAALATIAALEDGSIYERTFRLGDRMRAGLAEIAGRLGVEMVSAGFGSVFTPYFMSGKVERYEDLLANDTARDLAFRQGMCERGIFMLPMPIKRNHISAAHTDADIDRTLETAEIVMKTLR
ncbi:MAG TPA: aspartate aminotransferase family protein [Devosia sp.]|jgi:glutamate-1-semialdehyde 2,1-aminomutase|uniref:aspartate aminotransferase family protein n=1 Tax=Devosia sp. TaxID=1871048 RepID=UPI002DDD975A|nr:aspartate aminotransferase family protein [Devosia sp.]HEV2516445.1 aspartate aminotransferase family protein [Devosia sp.]